MKTPTKILIVDDDILSLRIYSRLLVMQGYEVATSHTAVGILGIIAEHGPDIIVMDHEMPVVTGFQAIKLLKANDQFRSIPVIYFSSVNNLPLLAIEAGSDAYVSKMGGPDELYAAIASMGRRLSGM